MANPTFNSFSLQDDNFITERVTFRGYPQRDNAFAQVNRREGMKLLGSEFTTKEISLAGVVIASSPSALQTLLDNMKRALTQQEGSLIVEDGRTFTATVSSIAIPDEHYNQSKAPFEVSFTCSKPYAVSSLLTVTIPTPSGQYTVSGLVNISGTFYARPLFSYNPPAGTGKTLIRRFDLYHVPTAQTTTVSGLGSGTSLSYSTEVTINLDTFNATEGGTAVDSSGSYPKFEPGTNNFLFTASGRAFPGGSLSMSYQPRYI